MKNSILKQALAVAALSVASVSAFADVALPSTGNGELVLYVVNNTQGTAYARGLGVNIDNVISTAGITGTYAGVTVGDQSQAVYSVPFSVTQLHDANLTAFLNQKQSTDNVTWSIQGSDNSASAGLGLARHVTTTALDASAGTSVLNTNLKTTTWGQLNGLQSADNNNIVGSTADDKGSTDITVAGSTYLSTNAHNWYGFGPESQVALGSTANFYMYTMSSSTNGNYALVLTLGTETLSASGDLTAPAPVPVPAAIWMLFSGLGSMGVLARRKKA